MATVLRVRTTLTYGSGGPGLNTMYWLPGTPGGVTADASDAVARVRAFFNSIRAEFATSMNFQVQSDVAQVDVATGVLTGLLAATPAAAVSGNGGVNNEVVAAMILVRARTNLVRNNRLVRGRWYLGPVSSAVGNGLGTITTGVITTVDAAALALLSGGATSSAPAVYHRPSLLGPGEAASVISFSTWDQFAVLRSRRDA